MVYSTTMLRIVQNVLNIAKRSKSYTKALSVKTPLF
jgi:hypothetical protein